jgi:hypothetical protein
LTDRRISQTFVECIRTSKVSFVTRKIFLKSG